MYTNHTEDMSRRGGSARDRRMRASDAEREATANVLRRHYTEGRLNAQEYDERIERCYAAKTLADLDELFVDLPRSMVREREPDRAHHDFRPPWRFAVVVPLVIALVVISALTGAHLFWLAWPLFFFVLGPFGLFGRWRRTGQDRWRGDGTTSV